jgi:hypothetical protein
MFCDHGLIFGGTEGTGSITHVLHTRTRFRRYIGHQVMFISFALPDPFSVVSREPCPVLMFPAKDQFSAVQRAPGPIFMICAPELISGGTEGKGSSFHIFVLPDSI